MLSKPNYGWSTLSLKMYKNYETSQEEKVNWAVSYLSNVPVDILTTFVDYKKTGRPQVCKFELEESGVGTMILSDDEIELINTTEENPDVYPFHDVGLRKTIKELINDIESNLDEWSNFYYEEDYLVNKLQIKNLLGTLKRFNK